MRRILLVTGVLALALVVPGAASAHGRHHHRHHHHKAHHARIKHLGAKPVNTDPGAPVSGDAGTVTSFADGVLTITLTDGSTVTGKVTDRTEIRCFTAVTPPPAPTATVAHDGGEGWGDDDEGDDNRGDGEGHHCHGPSACSVSDIVPGAIVHEAELRIGAAGSEFKEITLTK